jgi:hypothetical protein
MKMTSLLPRLKINKNNPDEVKKKKAVHFFFEWSSSISN